MVHSSLENIPSSRFTASTIRRMFELADRGKTDPTFQKLVYGVVNKALPGQWKCYRRELEALLSWAKGTVDYRRDPYGVELVQDVWATLDRKRADCDDFSTLLSAAAEILGSPTRFVTVSTRPDGEPSHVYLQAFADGEWLGMDAIVPHSFVGWEPPGVTSRKIWTRSSVGLSGDEDLSSVEGLGMKPQVPGAPVAPWRYAVPPAYRGPRTYGLRKGSQLPYLNLRALPRRKYRLGEAEDYNSVEPLGMTAEETMVEAERAQAAASGVQLPQPETPPSLPGDPEVAPQAPPAAVPAVEVPAWVMPAAIGVGAFVLASILFGDR